MKRPFTISWSPPYKKVYGNFGEMYQVAIPYNDHTQYQNNLESLKILVEDYPERFFEDPDTLLKPFIAYSYLLYETEDIEYLDTIKNKAKLYKFLKENQ